MMAAAGLLCTLVQCWGNHSQTGAGSPSLAMARESIEKRLQEISHDISVRLSAFADEVGADQQFSLRLLAENNRSAPEVTQKAGQFIRPMGFAVLDIADSSYTLLSSGEFPASAGQNVSSKVKLLSDDPKMLEDVIVGQKALTLQARHNFFIAGSIPFYALGGVIVDEKFLQGLTPYSGVQVLLKQGNTIVGMTVKTISDLKNGAIIINDKEYPAFEIDLPYTGQGEIPKLIGFVAQPK
jgi:hypothetical protein